jgi:hypothetical protein
MEKEMDHVGRGGEQEVAEQEWENLQEQKKGAMHQGIFLALVFLFLVSAGDFEDHCHYVEEWEWEWEWDSVLDASVEPLGISL